MPGLIRGIARTAAIAGTATAVSNRVSRRQAGRWAAQGLEQQQYDAPPRAVPGAAASAQATDTENRLAQLQQLGALQSQGVLSPAEFAAEKARILGS